MERKYIFQHECDTSHYTADVFVLRCFDDRFWKTWKCFLKNQGYHHIDPESVAGGAKIFSSPEKESDRDFMLRELEKSIALHNTHTVMLFSHHDCGAYGGIERFGGDTDAEMEFHAQEHQKAYDVIKERFPNIDVKTYFIDRHGILETVTRREDSG